MSYYPILSAPFCNGKTTLYNFPPNSWESVDNVDQVVSLTFSKDGFWHSKAIEKLKYQEYKIFNYSDIAKLTPDGALPLLSLSKEGLPEISPELPVINFNHTITPAHRATLSLQSKFSETVTKERLTHFLPRDRCCRFHHLCRSTTILRIIF